MSPEATAAGAADGGLSLSTVALSKTLFLGRFTEPVTIDQKTALKCCVIPKSYHVAGLSSLSFGSNECRMLLGLGGRCVNKKYRVVGG